MKKAIAKETISLGQMVNKGREFYVRKGSIGRLKLCNTPSNMSSIGDFQPGFVEKHFRIVEA